MNHSDDANAIASFSMIRPVEGLEGLERRKSEEAACINGDAHPDESDKANGSVHVEAPNCTVGSSKSTTDEPPKNTNDLPPQPRLRQSCTSQLGTELEGPIGYGSCGREWTFSNDIHICQVCIDVQFNNACVEKLRAGKIIDVCSPKHRFLHIPAWDPASVDRIRRGQVLVGDKEVPLKVGTTVDW